VPVLSLTVSKELFRACDTQIAYVLSECQVFVNNALVYSYKLTIWPYF
jgi:hypothetical protein